MYLCSWGLKSLEKITSFFGLLHLWNIIGRDKANENNEQGEILGEKIEKRQISWTNPAYRTTLWQHWGRRSKSPSHNFCSGGGVGIFLFKLSNKTWKTPSHPTISAQGGVSWDLSFQTFKQNMENLSPVQPPAAVFVKYLQCVLQKCFGRKSSKRNFVEKI